MNDAEIGVYFDECAQQGFMASFSPDEESKLDALFRLWNIESGYSLVEPGCGSGRLTERLARAVEPNGIVYAFDLSAEMISRALARKLPGHVRFVRDSVENIQTDDAIFDMAICFSVFPHFSTPERALLELHRVLKPGGSLWINHLKDRSTLNDMHRKAASVVIAHQIPEAEEMKELFANCGFEIVDVKDSVEDGYCLCAVKR